jgi:hypothetical protein
VQHLLEVLGPLRIERRVDSMRTARALQKRLLKALLVELMNDVAYGLVVAAEGSGDLVGVLSFGACKQDLAAAEDEGIRRTECRLQGLTLLIRQRTYEDRFSHGA